MNDWYDQARRRFEQKQQQDVLHQQQVLSELRRIVDAAGAQKKLEHIQKTIWEGCGLIEPISKNASPIYFAEYNQMYPGDFEAGLKLHFEYEVLKFVLRDSDPESRTDRRWKKLRRSTTIREVTIVAVQRGYDGSRELHFIENLHSIPHSDYPETTLVSKFDEPTLTRDFAAPVSNFAALVEALDETIYRYCEAARSA